MNVGMGTMKNEYGTVGVESGNMDNSADIINIDILSANTDGDSVNAVASATANDLRKSADLRKSCGFGVPGKMTFVAIISCTRDYVALEKSLDMVVCDNVKRVFLFGGNAPKRYEIPPRILELAENGTGAFFYNADAPETLVKVDAYLKGVGADVWFFLNAGDTVQELYTAYLESFFSYNKGKCGVVFTPVLTDGIAANLVKDDPRLPVEFQNLPKSGLFSFAEDYERFPKNGDGVSLLDGAAVLAEDAVEMGLDFEKGVVAFSDLIERAAKVKDTFGKLKMVYVGRGGDVSSACCVQKFSINENDEDVETCSISIQEILKDKDKAKTFVKTHSFDEIDAIQEANPWVRIALKKLKSGSEIILDWDEMKPVFTLEGHYISNAIISPVICGFEEYYGNVRIFGYYRVANETGITIAAKYRDEFYDSEYVKTDYRSDQLFGEIVYRTSVFDISFPYVVDGLVTLYVKILGYGYFPTKIRYNFSSRMREHVGAFIIGDAITIISTDASNCFVIMRRSTELINSLTERLIDSCNTNDKAKTTQVKIARETMDANENLLRKYVQSYTLLSRRRIWLFMDRINKADDNAEHLFKYALQQNDGVDKYFVLERNSPDWARMNKIGKVLEFGSEEHKMFNLFAECFISSTFSHLCIYPFEDPKSARLFQGFISAKFVFLQHGITKDDMAEYFSKWEKNVKLLVTASQMEYDSMNTDNYGYKDVGVVVLTGFPRFDALYSDPKKKIVFMPTWRNSLSFQLNKDGTRQYNVDFKNSEYFHLLYSVLLDTRLQDALKEYGYELEFKPHPNLYCQLSDFVPHGKFRVIPLEFPYRDVYAQASLMITDYSSAIFDFAYLKKPILYYQFDDRPLGDGYFDYETMGFGAVIHEHDVLIDAIIAHIRSGCLMSEKYQQRVDDFFAFTDKNNCKRVYDAVMGLRRNSSYA